MAKVNAENIRQQIAELQSQLADAEVQERMDALAKMKEMQKQYRFTQRELGHYFKARRKVG